MMGQKCTERIVAMMGQKCTERVAAMMRQKCTERQKIDISFVYVDFLL